MKIIFRKIIAYILRLECMLVLRKYKPKIVAITGSVGKTSTKDAVFAVLSQVAYVRKSEKSYNSQIGLPLTILGVSNGWNNPMMWLQNILKGLWLIIAPHKYPKWLVLEVGVGKPGDMKSTASWLKTDVVILTAIGETPAHIEFFHSRDHLIAEKGELIKTLKKEGTLIVNTDDEAAMGLKSKAKRKSVTYGTSDRADVVGSANQIFYSDLGEPAGIIFRADVEGNSLPVTMQGVFGKNHIYAALAALAFAYSEKLNMVGAVDALKSYDFPPGRMRLLRGASETTIIDDTYNSSPIALRAGLETMAEIKSDGRKIAVLGDMLELGRHTNDVHVEMGTLAKDKADILVVVGPRAKLFKEGALAAKMSQKKIFEFTNSTEAGEFLQTFIKKGDLVFIKGSQGIRMERAVEAILLDHKNKKKLLVRQDAEWLGKK